MPTSTPRTNRRTPGAAALITAARWCSTGVSRPGVFLAIALTVPSVIWVLVDRSIRPWDPAWYGQVSIELWAALKGGSLSHWADALQASFGAKPPGIAWLGEFFVPLRRVLGAPEPALLLSIVVTQFATLLLVYHAAWRVWRSRAAAALGMVVLGGAPLFVGLSRSYFAEPLQALAVAWAFFILASARRRHPAVTLVQIPGVVALGFLAKISTPIYIALPLLAALVACLVPGLGWRTPRWWARPSFVSSLAATVLLVAGCVGWYRQNLDRAVEHARFSAESPLWGARGSFVGDYIDWAGRLIAATFLPGFGLALIVLLGAGWWVVRDRTRRGSAGRSFPLGAATVGAAALTIAGVLISFALSANDEGRYMLPLLVCGALLLAALGAHAGPVTKFACGLAAMQAAAVLLVPFWSAALPQEVISSLRPAEATPAFRQELTRLVASTCLPATNGRISVIGAEMPWLNANTMTMYSADAVATSGRTCPYTSLGFAEQSPQRAWQRLVDFDAPYFVSLDFGNPRNRLAPGLAEDVDQVAAFNAVSRPVFVRAIRSGLFERVPGSARDGIVVLRRR